MTESERKMCDEIADEWIQRGGSAEAFCRCVNKIIDNIRGLDEIMSKCEVINQDIPEEG